MPGERKRVLILGGTAEARRLAEHLTADGRYDVITSLAGRTTAPETPPGTVRTGGFGGSKGLKNFLQAERINLVADATHPFAATISANAVAACADTQVPCIRLERPPWRAEPGDQWISATGISEAATTIPSGATALVTVGRQEIAPFFMRTDVHVVARMIEPPSVDIPPHAELILARPPFTLAQERALMEEKRIDVLVTKNSGGDATAAKLAAARALTRPVIMIARPPPPDVPSAATADAVAAWIAERLE